MCMIQITTLLNLKRNMQFVFNVNLEHVNRPLYFL